MKQSIKRQIDNIKAKYPAAIIVEESFTGTKIDRPAFTKLLKAVKAGDTIVFDEVSRMSRNAEDGFKLYEELYNKGVELVFLKESTLNTENFRQTQQIACVGNEIADMYIETTNKVLMILARQQIIKAFESAQSEVDFLHQRTKEGIAQARLAGKQIGNVKGQKYTTKKSLEMKNRIKELSKDFAGHNNDIEVMKILGIAKNTYYKYKRELLEESAD
jgi:DNA invertase Pin-like site-specific DNA recombinase